jgi:5-methylcytosine-specific restriction endonuclease McrA
MSQFTNRNSAQRERDRQTIKRTGAGCHICGKMIDYTLPHLDPMAFEVDHLVPLARCGSDTLANKAAAHRSCNSKKRTRDYAPIVRRSNSLD